MNSSEPGTVLDLRGDLFGRVEAIKRLLDAPQRRQCVPQVDAQIDRQRGPLVGRQMLDGGKRAFEMLNRDAVCCTGDFPCGSGLEMNDRAVP